MESEGERDSDSVSDQLGLSVSLLVNEVLLEAVGIRVTVVYDSESEADLECVVKDQLADSEWLVTDTLFEPVGILVTVV